MKIVQQIKQAFFPSTEIINAQEKKKYETQETK